MDFILVNVFFVCAMAGCVGLLAYQLLRTRDGSEVESHGQADD